jgi:hypothetical protein
VFSLFLCPRECVRICGGQMGRSAEDVIHVCSHHEMRAMIGKLWLLNYAINKNVCATLMLMLSLKLYSCRQDISSEIGSDVSDSIAGGVSQRNGRCVVHENQTSLSQTLQAAWVNLPTCPLPAHRRESGANFFNAPVSGRHPKFRAWKGRQHQPIRSATQCRETLNGRVWNRPC